MVAKTPHRRLDHHIGPRYEKAFRSHLRRLVIAGEFGEEVLRIGSYWTTGRQQVEIDAGVLSGTPPEAIAVGECKWAARAGTARLPACSGFLSWPEWECGERRPAPVMRPIRRTTATRPGSARPGCASRPE
jgi:hypothetical protein